MSGSNLEFPEIVPKSYRGILGPYIKGCCKLWVTPLCRKVSVNWRSCFGPLLYRIPYLGTS